MLIADGYMEFLYSAGTVAGINHPLGPLGTFRGVAESQLDSISIELGGLKWDFDGAFRVAELELGLRTWTGGALRQ
jgi:hypothetical protein